MNLYDQYADWTDTTAKYPVTAPAGYCSEPSYLALGIADESGELSIAMPGTDRLKEGGDVLWYAARYAKCVLGVPFSEVVEAACNILPHQCKYITTHLGIICGVEKKRIRDGHLWDEKKKAEKKGAAWGALVNVVGWVRLELMAANYTLEDAIDANMGKLEARAAAGTLQGDGDNR